MARVDRINLWPAGDLNPNNKAVVIIGAAGAEKFVMQFKAQSDDPAVALLNEHSFDKEAWEASKSKVMSESGDPIIGQPLNNASSTGGQIMGRTRIYGAPAGSLSLTHPWYRVTLTGPAAQERLGGHRPGGGREEPAPRLAGKITKLEINVFVYRPWDMGPGNVVF